MPEGPDETVEISTPSAEPAPATTPLHVDEDPAHARPAGLGLLFIAVAAGGFLIGIALASTLRPATDEGTVAARGAVGPDGGTLRFDGGHLRIPRGALAEPVTIVVRRGRIDDRVEIRPPGEPIVFQPGRLAAYTFGPRDVTFRRPVELTFRLPSDARNAAVFARTTEGTEALDGVIDADAGTATVEIRDFRFGMDEP